jgi:D-3-phosphoglycerate dehydrogenase
MAFKVLVTDLRHESIERERHILSAIGAEVIAGFCETEEEVLEFGTDFDALMVSYTPIGEKIFSKMPKLKVVVKYGVGYDNIDLEAATRWGVAVCNVRHHCIEEVSTHAVGLLLCAVRRICYFNTEVRNGVWRDDPSTLDIVRMKGKNLGIVGLGNIGGRFAEKMSAFGVNILVYDPYIPVAKIEGRGYQRVEELGELFSRCNFISIHCPLNNETRGMISTQVLSMAKGLILINTARGAIVDTASIAGAIRNGDVLIYAADVLSEEPPYEGDESLRFLLNSEKVIITPHCAWYSRESEEELIEGTAQEVLNVLSGKMPRSLLNPEVRKRWK